MKVCGRNAMVYACPTWKDVFSSKLVNLQLEGFYSKISGYCYNPKQKYSTCYICHSSFPATFSLVLVDSSYGS